jgi:hypothetical protein
VLAEQARPMANLSRQSVEAEIRELEAQKERLKGREQNHDQEEARLNAKISILNQLHAAL